MSKYILVLSFLLPYFTFASEYPDSERSAVWRSIASRAITATGEFRSDERVAIYIWFPLPATLGVMSLGRHTSVGHCSIEVGGEYLSYYPIEGTLKKVGRKGLPRDLDIDMRDSEYSGRRPDMIFGIKFPLKTAHMKEVIREWRDIDGGSRYDLRARNCVNSVSDVLVSGGFPMTDCRSWLALPTPDPVKLASFLRTTGIEIERDIDRTDEFAKGLIGKGGGAVLGAAIGSIICAPATLAFSIVGVFLGDSRCSVM